MLVSVASEASWGIEGGLRVMRLPPIAVQQRNGTFAPASLVHAPQPRGLTGILLVPGSGLQRTTFTQLLQVRTYMHLRFSGPRAPLSCRELGTSRSPSERWTADGGESRWRRRWCGVYRRGSSWHCG